MRVTDRDVRLVRDLILSQILSRDQLIALEYFGSTTRANTRLRALRKQGFVRVFETPFHNQHLYLAGASARQVVDGRLAALVAGRNPSPRYIQHCLTVTNIRIALKRKNMTGWRFEAQLATTFQVGTRTLEVRPDGLAIFPTGVVAIEADMGHVPVKKFQDKLTAYDAFLRSGACHRTWGYSTFRLLTITTGHERAHRLKRLLPSGSPLQHRCLTLEDFGLRPVGGWS